MGCSQKILSDGNTLRWAGSFQSIPIKNFCFVRVFLFSSSPFFLSTFLESHLIVDSSRESAPVNFDPSSVKQTPLRRKQQGELRGRKKSPAHLKKKSLLVYTRLPIKRIIIREKEKPFLASDCFFSHHSSSVKKKKSPNLISLRIRRTKGFKWEKYRVLESAHQQQYFVKETAVCVYIS